MPAKNSLKEYVENGYYHVYNRGVAKNDIFLDAQDYGVFLSYLKEYLSPPITPPREEIINSANPYQRNNFFEQIRLLAYCLMPNHFHLLVRQNEPRTIEEFMRSFSVRYSGYFNKRYKRVGHLFQGVYKGVLITHDNYLWWLSRYIHRNPLEIMDKAQLLFSYNYSSYAAYLGLTNPAWIETATILNQIRNYQAFVEGTKEDFPLEDLALEEITI